MGYSQQVRVTKKFTFDMAHALFGYDGPCKNIHGHTYHLSVTLIGAPSQSLDDVKLGMVVDFGDLKKVILVPYQPTCENLLLDFVQRLKPLFNEDRKLVSIRLEETPTSYAEWNMSDNL